jgi:hypothetical protein
MSKAVSCTIVSVSYLNQALTSVESLRTVHPEFDFVVVIIDLKENYLYVENNLSVTSLHNFFEKYPEIRIFYNYYNLIETICALKPFVSRYLLESYDTVVYIDSDTYFYNPIDLYSNSLKLGGFTPHSLTPSSNHEIFFDSFDISILKFGYFNLGFFIVTRKDLVFLNWWSQKLTFECLYAPELFLFVDQKWLDLGSHFFGLNSIIDESLNIGPWNLDERIITKDSRGYLVNKQHIKMIHFSGVSISRPESHVKDFYNLDNLESNELKESIANYINLSKEWLIRQGFIETKFHELISNISNFDRLKFARISFFEKVRRIEDIRLGKHVPSRKYLIHNYSSTLFYKIDMFLSKSESYKFGRVYLKSDLQKLKSLLYRLMP